MWSELVAARADIETLRTSLGNALRVGSVVAVDADKGYRVKWGQDAEGGDWLSPWYPHPESGGTNSTWLPLSVGQVVGIVQPNGDPRQGLLIRGGFSGGNPAPSGDLDEVALVLPGVEVRVKNGSVSIKASGTVTVEAAKVELGGDGGKPVARIGDLVNVGSGSSTGLWPIVEGSPVVNAI